MTREEEIIQQLAEAESERTVARQTMTRLQRELMDIESTIIELCVRKERLLEELRRIRNAKVV